MAFIIRAGEFRGDERVGVIFVREILMERFGVETAGDDRDAVRAGFLEPLDDPLFHFAVAGLDAGIKFHGAVIQRVQLGNVRELHALNPRKAQSTRRKVLKRLNNR